MSAQVIYKLLPRAEWEAAQTEGVYRGSAHDKRDGFIHFSTAAQLGETARKHFSGVSDLVLLAVEVAALASPPSPQPSPRGERESAAAPSPRWCKRPLSPWGERQSEGVCLLRWEPSRGGDLFPHLYADLPIAAVKSATPVPLGQNGTPIVPSDLAS
jgi:uncharacterized protein (DUF952 family)